MSLGSALPAEQARARGLLAMYREIGSAGAFGVMVIEDALRRADQAAISGDVLAMMRSYEELRGLK